jgi:NADH dehydrogenase
MTVRGHSKQTLKSPPKFSYNDKGSMATIGRNKAVADIHFAKFGGFLAWLGWLFISPYISHWLKKPASGSLPMGAWAYFTYARGAPDLR